MENIIDENLNPDEKQDTTSSVEKTNPNGGVRKDEKTSLEEEGSVPRWRVKELTDEKNQLTDEKNQLKDTLETLKTEIELLKQRQPELEEEPPSDWKEAEKRTIDKAVSQIRKELTTREEQDRLEEATIELKFQQLSNLGEKITPETKKSVLREMIESGNDDVLAIYLAQKAKSSKTENAELLKKEGFVPSSQKGSAAEGKSLSYKELRSRTLDDLIGG